MEVRVIYHDKTDDQHVTLLEKKYAGLPDAFIPKINDVLTVYSCVIEETLQIKVIEILAMIERDYDQFDILVERLE